MKTSDLGRQLILHFIQFKRRAVQEDDGNWVIGFDTTFYFGIRPVKEGDMCTIEQAYEWFNYDLDCIEVKITNWLKWGSINQNQFDSLVSFVFDEGTALCIFNAVKRDPNDPNIWAIFAKYSKAKKDGKPYVLTQKLRKRMVQAHLYRLGEVNYYDYIK